MSDPTLGEAYEKMLREIAHRMKLGLDASAYDQERMQRLIVINIKLLDIMGELEMDSKHTVET